MGSLTLAGGTATPRAASAFLILHFASADCSRRIEKQVVRHYRNFLKARIED
jgi:hypothetical protein